MPFSTILCRQLSWKEGECEGVGLSPLRPFRELLTSENILVSSGASGELSEPSEASESLKEPLGPSGNLRESLEALGSLWRASSAEPSDRLWEP